MVNNYCCKLNRRRHSHYLNVTVCDLISSVLQRDAVWRIPKWVHSEIKYSQNGKYSKRKVLKTEGTHIFNVNTYPCYILLTCEVQRMGGWIHGVICQLIGIHMSNDFANSNKICSPSNTVSKFNILP